MRLGELCEITTGFALLEAFPYPPGSDAPASVTDLRDPAQAKGRYRSYAGDFGKRQRYWDKTPLTCVVLTKAGGLLVYYYGDRNTVPWGEVMTRAQGAMDRTLQDDIQGVVVHGTGYLLGRSRETGAWSGDRTAHSADVAATAQALLDRGAATLSTPIWIGNWAARSGEHVGTVRSLVARRDPRKSLTLYHGTSTLRLATIMQDGLKPLDLGERVWNKGGAGKKRPAHRDEAVYLSASRPQAEYYAKKAVDIDRARNGPARRAEASRAPGYAQARANRMAAELDWIATLTPQQKASMDEHTRRYERHGMTIAQKERDYPAEIARERADAERLGAKAVRGAPGKIEPAVLQVTLRAREFERLMADDDHLAQQPGADPADWQGSLGHFGQVAFRGTIPPDRIRVLATGKDAGRTSR